jgi:hypothetical protein
MATGRLQSPTALSATTLASVYNVPTGNYAVFNVSFTNTTSSAVTIRLALSTSSTSGGINAADYIEYDTTIVPKGVFERTGLVGQAGLYVWAYSSAANVNVTVYGIETSTT